MSIKDKKKKSYTFIISEYDTFNFTVKFWQKNLSGTRIEPVSPPWKGGMITTTLTAPEMFVVYSWVLVCPYLVLVYTEPQEFSHTKRP